MSMGRPTPAEKHLNGAQMPGPLSLLSTSQRRWCVHVMFVLRWNAAVGTLLRGCLAGRAQIDTQVTARPVAYQKCEDMQLRQQELKLLLRRGNHEPIASLGAPAGRNMEKPHAFGRFHDQKDRIARKVHHSPLENQILCHRGRSRCTYILAKPIAVCVENHAR